MVDSIVQEQNLSGASIKILARGSSFSVHEESNSSLHDLIHDCNNRCNSFQCNNCQDSTDNTHGKVIYQHFKSGRNLPSVLRSNCLIIQALTGPTIIAPINIGTLEPTITPIAEIAPMTPASLSVNCRTTCIGDQKRQQHRSHRGYQSSDSFIWIPALLEINSAVINPHAINAPIFGITITLRG